ncbi:hypothetical protein G6F51_009086 [Rhizopus arrhizus]|uniref:Uncharacterized protein n=1 Tax=Rhizopus oryzae TaxID=64495 RepID=A0A9P6Y4S9_RHIOR|nr:hypothetical protein G6F51_009086 [Rhizopus arrhizus]
MAAQNNIPMEINTINNAQDVSPLVPADIRSTSSQEATEPVLPYQNDADMMETADENLLVTDSTDSLTILRQQLQEVSQRFARGVSNHLPMDQLESLRNEASHIANCIKYLLEGQIYCDPPKVETTQQSVNQSSNRFDHFIPNDLPTWQWVGNVWRMDVEVHDSVEDLLDTFALITLNNIDQVLTIKMQQNESIEAFTDRFQRIRRAAKWQDDIRAAALFNRALPVALYKEVSRSLLNLPLNEQDSVCKVSAKACTVISSNICNDEAMAASVTKRNIISQSAASPISFPKSKCLVHGNGNHTTEQCKVLKRIATANTATTATTATNVTPQASNTKKNCYKCSANVPWSPDHAATCSRDKVKRFNGPTKAFRSARFSGSHNRKNIDTLALVDSGASFSSIDIAFANKNNININNNVSGSIVFATNDNKSKRFGTTSKALSLIYGDNDDTLIHTSHIFEVLPLSFDTDAVIGLDLMPRLNILIENLAVKHPNCRIPTYFKHDSYSIYKKSE